jgi:hypothetical protein
MGMAGGLGMGMGGMGMLGLTSMGLQPQANLTTPGMYVYIIFYV